MAHDTTLADRVRKYLAQFSKLPIEEKRMFRGLAFLVDGKMCVNVSGENLMCRFDPTLTKDLEEKPGFLPMVMKGKKLKGYCYVESTAIKTEKHLAFWINLCLEFNDKAKSSKK